MLLTQVLLLGDLSALWVLQNVSWMMSSRTWLLGFQWLWDRFIGVSASGVLLTLDWGCGSGSHWSDVCRLSGSFHTLHMAKVRGRGQIPMGFQDYWICFFFTSIPAWQPKATMWGKKETLTRRAENLQRGLQTCDCSSSSGVHAGFPLC